jgi:hypothetical protein
MIKEFSMKPKPKRKEDILQDGQVFRSSLMMRDQQTVSDAMAKAGGTVLADGLPSYAHRPGYRQSAQHVDRQPINDAYAAHERYLNDAYKLDHPAALSDPDPSINKTDDPDEDDHNFEQDSNKIKRFQRVKEHEAGHSDTDSLRALRDAAYAEHIAYLENSWRRN